MKKVPFLLTILLIASFAFPNLTAFAENGVDDLRGRWEVDWSLDNPFPGAPDTPQTSSMFIEEVRESTITPGTFFASGCMSSPESEVLMPLSLRAVYDQALNKYEIRFLSTIVPVQSYFEPYLVRFDGSFMVSGSGVNDDHAEGMLMTRFSMGEWSAEHHDRRKVHCPGVEGIDLHFDPDVYAHQDLNPDHPMESAVLESRTVIVSSGMRVEAPDGSIYEVQEYTDIFSPDVDFIDSFRYLSTFEVFPISGTYHFVLLDTFGNPIPGTEASDIWYGCNQGAPLNLSASIEPSGSTMLTWDPVADFPGQFEPADGVGFYQNGLGPFQESPDSNFGSNDISSPYHLIPWDPFEPGTPGEPNGTNYGVSLSEFQEGYYRLNVYAFAYADPQGGGFGLECAVHDSSADLYMEKQNNQADFYTFEQITISGHVYDSEGNPLGGIGVDLVEGGYGYCTDEFGYYELTILPLGNFAIAAGRDFCGNSQYGEQVFENIPSGSANVDFYLVKLGEPISGHVYDSDGNPLGGIGVDTVDGGYGTCTDEFGYYELSGLPVGNYAIAAGRDFCGNGQFEEQVFENVPTGSANLDFYLAEAHHIEVFSQPEHEWVFSPGWTVGDLITLQLDIDPELQNGYELTLTQTATPEDWNPEIGSVQFNDFSPYDLVPGMLVELTDGTYTITLLVETLAVNTFDENTKTVSGSAPPGREVGVGVHQPSYNFWMVTTADGDGNWVADFSGDSTLMTGVFDIHAMIWDEDGDATQANYYFP